MNSNPILINSLTDKGCRLNRVEASSGDSKNEDWLQNLLYRHPELLPVDEFDEMFAPPIPIGREVQSGRGPIDNLYISPNGGITIVETKLWKNPEKHRTVVAQIIDYAKELATWGYDDLAEAVLAASRGQNETELPSLEEKLAASLKDNPSDLVEFQENVVTNLQEGNFLLLIVGDRISPNLALLADAIHSAPHLRFQLGLVEMRMHPLVAGRDWPLIVVPDVVGRTVEKVRGVVRVRYEREKPEVTVEIEANDPKPGHVGTIDIEGFLAEIPKDLVEPYQEAIEKWESDGGDFDLTEKMIHFVAVLNGYRRRFIRCRTFQMSLVHRKDFAKWSQDLSLYDGYLDRMDESPVLGNLARNGKQWVNYDKLGPDDLRVLLNAGMSLAMTIQKAEEEKG